MMKLKVFAVRDNAVGLYCQPHYSRTPGEALRAFEQAVTQEGSQFNKFAKDYALYMIGEYDEESGQHNSQHPVEIANALAIVANQDVKGDSIQQIDISEITGLEEQARDRDWETY